MLGFEAEPNADHSSSPNKTLLEGHKYRQCSPGADMNKKG